MKTFTSDTRPSLFAVLGIIIILMVLTIMGLHSVYNYRETQKNLSNEMKQNLDITLSSLKKNVAHFIESYALNEYDQLIYNAMEDQNHFAIIVNDYNMGKISGNKPYTTGKIRDNNWRIIDYKFNHSEHNKQLEQSFYSKQYEISSESGESIGTIRIYLSDRFMNEELNQLIKTSLINTTIISIILILSLYLSIRRYILKPLSSIVKVIKETDESGIPTKEVSSDGTKEILALSKTLNTMVQAIKSSRMALNEQHQYLQTVIDGVHEPIMVINKDFTVELKNKALLAENHLNKFFDPSHPRCFEYSNHCSDPSKNCKQICPMKEVMKTGKPLKVIHEYNNIEGKKQFVELSTTPLLDNNGNCTSVIEISRDVTSYIELQEELREQKNTFDYLAHHDPLTGLANRALFRDRLEQSINKSRRHKCKMALLFIDLDHFKEINDSMGHHKGDEILIDVTQRLNYLTRKEDTLARLGGDEFTIIMEEINQEQNASILATKILQTLSMPFIINEHSFYLSASIGISLYPDDGHYAQDLLKYADAAMYKAKDEGRNNFQYYNAQMTDMAFERVVMETSLNEALKKKELVVYYQPQIYIEANGDSKLLGMEALVRWLHPTMGLIPPSKFIPLAEATGLIVQLDQFVMKTAMKQLIKWYEQGLKPGKLALNLSMKQLHQKDFISILDTIIKETNCPPEHFELEITESQLMGKPEEAIEVLNQLSSMGIELAVDDFGTGYSSLSYLKKLPINKLKIDQSFIRGLPDDNEDVAISKAIIALAQALNLNIIAEGVETKEQKEFLLENGCSWIQGYLYSKPMAAEEMEKYIKDGLN